MPLRAFFLASTKWDIPYRQFDVLAWLWCWQYLFSCFESFTGSLKLTLSATLTIRYFTVFGSRLRTLLVWDRKCTDPENLQRWYTLAEFCLGSFLNYQLFRITSNPVNSQIVHKTTFHKCLSKSGIPKDKVVVWLVVICYRKWKMGKSL